jgi:hypothetical protein
VNSVTGSTRQARDVAASSRARRAGTAGTFDHGQQLFDPHRLDEVGVEASFATGCQIGGVTISPHVASR